MAHCEKFLASLQSQCIAIKRHQNIESPVDPVTEGADSGNWIPVCAADGFRDDFVDQVEFLQVLRGQPQGFRGGLGFVRAAPQDRRAASGEMTE